MLYDIWMPNDECQICMSSLNNEHMTCDISSMNVMSLMKLLKLLQKLCTMDADAWQSYGSGVNILPFAPIIIEGKKVHQVRDFLNLYPFWQNWGKFSSCEVLFLILSEVKRYIHWGRKGRCEEEYWPLPAILRSTSPATRVRPKSSLLLSA